MKLVPIEKISLAIFGVAALSTISVAGVLFPDHLATSNFWLRVGWFVFLIFLNWFASTAIFVAANEKRSISGLMGILPAVNIVVFVYSIVSSVLLLMSMMSDGAMAEPRYHLTTQIVMAAVAALLVLLAMIAATTAKTSRNAPIGEAIRPKILVQRLKSLEAALSSEPDGGKAIHLVKSLREKLSYSLPSETRCLGNLAYAAFSVDLFSRLGETGPHVEAKELARDLDYLSNAADMIISNINE